MSAATRKTAKNIKTEKFKIRRLYLPVAFAAFLGLVYALFFIPPTRWQEISYAPFFLLFAASLFFTLSIFIKKIIIPILITLSANSILIIRLIGYKELAYPILIIGLTITLIYFFTLPEENDKVPADSSNNKTDDSHGSNLQTKP